jgi:hypothetical protein
MDEHGKRGYCVIVKVSLRCFGAQKKSFEGRIKNWYKVLIVDTPILILSVSYVLISSKLKILSLLSMGCPNLVQVHT